MQETDVQTAPAVLPGVERQAEILDSKGNRAGRTVEKQLQRGSCRNLTRETGWPTGREQPEPPPEHLEAGAHASAKQIECLLQALPKGLGQGSLSPKEVLVLPNKA